MWIQIQFTKNEFFRPAYTVQGVWSEFSASADDSRIRPNNTDIPSDFRATVLWLEHDDVGAGLKDRCCERRPDRAVAACDDDCAVVETEEGRDRLCWIRLYRLCFPVLGVVNIDLVHCDVTVMVDIVVRWGSIQGSLRDWT